LPFSFTPDKTSSVVEVAPKVVEVAADAFAIYFSLNSLLMMQLVVCLVTRSRWKLSRGYPVCLGFEIAPVLQIGNQPG
jgi:hypothetical protein